MRPVTTLALLLALTAPAIADTGTAPKSATRDLLPMDAVARRTLPPADVDALREEDARRARFRMPHRVAFPQFVAIDLHGAATREPLPGGGTVHRLRLDAPGAIFVSAKFSAFSLPPGATLHLVSVHHRYADGPFTSRHNQATGRFGAPPVPGDAMILELYLPPGAGAWQLTVESVSHGYRDAFNMKRVPLRDAADLQDLDDAPVESLGDGGSFSCQRDIICPEGEPYRDQARASAEGYDGQFVCSGQLINNVRQDNRYLYITAEHCGWWQDPSTMSFFWDYENQTCGGNDFPPFTFSTGSTELYHSPNPTTDVDLLELHGTDLEGQFDVYFLGWNRRTTPADMGAVIGYPDDKPKQIAITFDPIIDCAPGGCASGFGPNYWRLLTYDVGATEGGSSGSCLLDESNLLVGVLTGGVGTHCFNFEWDEFSKLHADWPQLQPFLDPDDTGLLAIPGLDGTAPEPTGACCFAGGQCEVKVKIECLSAGGAYLGDLTLCTPDACPLCDAPPNGDINQDGATDGRDVATMTAALAGTPAEEQICAGDYNGDETLTPADLPGFVTALTNPAP